MLRKSHCRSSARRRRYNETLQGQPNQSRSGTDSLSRDLPMRDCCSPRPTKRRSSKSARRARKGAATRARTKFTIQYFRNAKHPKALTFDLSSFEQARRVARIAGEFAQAAVHSFIGTSEDGRTETWLYREGTSQRKRR